VAARHEARKQERVLVIEEEPPMLGALAVVLAADGYRADVAKNGQEGLATAALCQPDAIIVDLALPDQNGIEVIKVLRGGRGIH
jgi:two-component system, OmpR family, KDP operon response regulator KdpE